MRRLVLTLAGALLAAQSSIVLACGFCIEDKVAAAYDHAVIKHAVERGHEIVFIEIAGGVPLTRAQWHGLVRTVENISGVERGSARTSDAPSVFSFELDAARSTAAKALQQINEKLRPQRVRVELVKVLNERQGVALR